MLSVSFSAPAKREQELRDALRIVDDWYDRDEVTHEITALAAGVNRWLMTDKGRTDTRGDEVSGDPWWGDLPPTTDPDAVDLQISAMRQLAWGTGMRVF